MKYRLRTDFSHDEEKCLEEILANRGVEAIEDFLNPSKENELDPFLLDNIEEGARLLIRHLEEDSPIMIIVDSDADGYTSAAILWLYCKKVYPRANLSFSIHEGKQHGLSDKAEWLEEQNFKLIVLPDSSSGDFAYHEALAKIGIDLLVLDHHECEKYSENAVVINNQLSEKYGNKSLCGAGIVYKFCEVLDKMLNKNYAESFLDLVALGEISDVMSQTTSETRYLITRGLRNIKNLGFVELVEAQSFSLKEKADYPYYGLTPTDIAFYVTPLINAIVRVGTHAEKQTLFISLIDPGRTMQSTKKGASVNDTETAASQTARVATNCRSRQNRIKEKAIELIDQRIHKEGLLDNSILIVEIEEEDGIPSTMTGLIAAFFVTKYRRPCALVRRDSKDSLRGSMRGSQNFEQLSDFKKFLTDSELMEYVEGLI